MPKYCPPVKYYCIKTSQFINSNKVAMWSDNYTIAGNDNNNWTKVQLYKYIKFKISQVFYSTYTSKGSQIHHIGYILLNSILLCKLGISYCIYIHFFFFCVTNVLYMLLRKLCAPGGLQQTNRPIYTVIDSCCDWNTSQKLLKVREVGISDMRKQS